LAEKSIRHHYNILGIIFGYEKLSKKEKRKLDQARRSTWGELNPVTRKPGKPKAYNRKRAQNWKNELPVPRLLPMIAATAQRRKFEALRSISRLYV